MTTLLVILNYSFFMTPVLSFDCLINFPNQGPLVVQAVSANTIPSLKYILSPNPNYPAPYQLSQAMDPFLVDSHFRWSVCFLFLNKNLRSLQSKLVTTSYVRV